VRGQFSVNVLGGNLMERLQSFSPDIIHLHWINAGYVSIGEIARLRSAVFWTAHDMWPFTGGCHYDQDCGRFENGRCATCPMQYRFPTFPLARQRLQAKVAASEIARVNFILPSRWMKSVANRSVVGRDRPLTVIPNAIDVERFKPIDQVAARALLGLPADRVLLLFGGVLSDTDPRKGFGLLHAALEDLSKTAWAEQISICIFGSDMRSDGFIHGMPVRYVGQLHDDVSLVALYSACDVFLAPSLQDNLPNTVMEAGACGRPSVAFDIGGMPDLIEHGVSGWLAAPGDSAAFAEGIVQMVRSQSFRIAAGAAARRQAVRSFSYDVVAAAHLAAYRQRLGFVQSSK
jgi:glycosyltransferase involved in cell wall biosynthesis